VIARIKISRQSVSPSYAPKRFRMRNSGLQLSVLRLRVLAIGLLMIGFIGMMIIGPESILPSQAGDAQSIASLSTQSDEVNSFDGYAAMAFIYSHTTSIIRYLILVLFGLGFFSICAYRVNNIYNFTMLLYVSIAPILLFLCFFVKDTFYIPFMLASLFLLSKLKNNMLATIFVACLYIIYGFIFRNYFLIISFIFVALILFRKSPGIFKFLIVISIPVVMMFIPDDIYTLIQQQRDIVNRGRIGYAGSGNRTAFVNLLPPEGVYSFFVNYAYAIVRLNLPVIFGAGLKEVFMMSNIIVLGLLVFVGLYSSDSRIWRPTILFCAHFLTLMLFEPDLGSYLRHIMTSLPLLSPALGIIGPNQKFYPNIPYFSRKSKGKPPRSTRAPLRL
jgi:hypothetical protein